MRTSDWPRRPPPPLTSARCAPTRGATASASSARPRDAFAEQGAEAQMDDVARAGRRRRRDRLPPLPHQGRAASGELVRREVRASRRGAARRSRSRTRGRPSPAMLRRDAELMAEDAGLRDALAACGRGRGDAARPTGPRSHAVAAELIDRAQAAGVLRDGLRRRRHPDAHGAALTTAMAHPEARLAAPPRGRARRAARAG